MDTPYLTSSDFVTTGQSSLPSFNYTEAGKAGLGNALVLWRRTRHRVWPKSRENKSQFWRRHPVCLTLHHSTSFSGSTSWRHMPPLESDDILPTCLWGIDRAVLCSGHAIAVAWNNLIGLYETSFYQDTCIAICLPTSITTQSPNDRQKGCCSFPAHTDYRGFTESEVY